MLYKSKCLRIKLSRYIPLKQGLRLTEARARHFWNVDHYYSTKTRIKTILVFFDYSVSDDHYYSTKTRIFFDYDH